MTEECDNTHADDGISYNNFRHNMRREIFKVLWNIHAVRRRRRCSKYYYKIGVWQEYDGYGRTFITFAFVNDSGTSLAFRVKQNVKLNDVHIYSIFSTFKLN